MVSQRMLFLIGFLFCAGLIGTALYLEHIDGLEPCPLCVFQRIVVIAVGVWLLLAALHNPKTTGRRIYGAITFILAVVGGGIAARHVWLQSLPADEVPDCGPDLSYMIDTFPLAETLMMVFSGSGECAEVQWNFLSLSIPQWTLVVFAGFAILGLWLSFTRSPRHVKKSPDLREFMARSEKGRPPRF